MTLDFHVGIWYKGAAQAAPSGRGAFKGTYFPF